MSRRGVFVRFEHPNGVNEALETLAMNPDFIKVLCQRPVRPLVCVWEANGRDVNKDFIEKPGVIALPRFFHTIYVHFASVDVIQDRDLLLLWKSLFVVRAKRGLRGFFCVRGMNENVPMNLQHIVSEPTFFSTNTIEVQQTWRTVFNQEFMKHVAGKFDVTTTLGHNISCYNNQKTTVVIMSWTPALHNEFTSYFTSILSRLGCRVQQVGNFQFCPVEHFRH